jgi:hypothetical protein
MTGAVEVGRSALVGGSLRPKGGAGLMAEMFKCGDHVEWNSEAGIVSGW